MSRRRAAMQWITRALMVVFLCVLGWLLIRHARSIDWHDVLAVLTGYRPGLLMAVGALAAFSYSLFCGYDLTARHYADHALRTSRVIAIAFVSYAVSLNLGALIGGGGIRFRLYSHAGLPLRVISRVVGFSVLTNWLGYFVLAGLLLIFNLPTWPRDWPMSPLSMRVVGGALLLMAAFYLAACAWYRDRTWQVFSHVIQLPALRLATLQTLLSCLNWLVISAMPYLLLQQHVGYPTVLGVLMLGGIISALTHIPAGLGVVEGVFVMMLGTQLETSRILAALLAYRGIYYLAPLLPALAMFLYLEAHQLRRVRSMR